MEDEDFESEFNRILTELGLDYVDYPDFVVAVRSAVDALERIGVTSSVFWDLLRGVASMEPG